MKDLIIIGAGGFGREVVWLVERINHIKPTWNIKGFLDDDNKLQNCTINGYPILGKCDKIVDCNNIFVVCAIGKPVIRKRIIDRIKRLNPKVQFATLVDPSVIKSESIQIGEGSIICARTILTTNIVIGEHVIVNLSCTLGHDVVVRNYSTLYPTVNLSGQTEIEESVEIGTGSTIIQGLRIGNNTIIGAGAVVINDIKEKGTYVGVPARKKE